MDEGRRRCARCGQAFVEAENGDAACLYHPGRLLDYNRLNEFGSGAPGDFWECCLRQVEPGVTPLDVPACAVGRHVEADRNDPGPVRRELEWQEELDRRIVSRLKGTRSARPSDAAVLERIHDSFSRDPALESHLVKLLGHLDAGRAVDAVHGVAHRADLLRESLSQAVCGDEPPETVAELIAACEDYTRDYGAGNEPIGALPHLGWQQVIQDLPAAAERYGFSSTRSMETFAELLRYLSRACHGMARFHSDALEVVAEIAKTTTSPQHRCQQVRALISREADECGRIGRVLDRAGGLVREVLGQTEDFAGRRRLLKERGQSEPDAAVAGLLQAIGNVLSPWAWLRRSPESRLVTCQPVGDYRLRLGFADGMVREIELGEDYWSTTGLSVDPEVFRGVQLDVERNVLVWTNGNEIPGERLHLAIEEGRLVP